MPSTANTQRNHRNFANAENRYDAKREALVRCARKLGEAGNAAKVSVSDVTDDMGITRGLFYYYFNSKTELNTAIADSYVADLLEAVELAFQDATDDRGDTMRTLASCLRTWQYDEDGGYRPMQHVLSETGLHDYVRTTAAEQLARLLIEYGLVIDYGKGGNTHLTHRVRLVTMGLLGEVHLHPEETVDELADAACAALRYRRHRRKAE